MCLLVCVCVLERELIIWNTRVSLALKRGESRAVHYWWVTHIADRVTNTHTVHARTPTDENTGYIWQRASLSSPRVFNSSCWHTYSTCYTLGFQHLSLWSIWDCQWPCTVHYLSDGVFDPTVQAELSPSLMLSLAESRAGFHYSNTQTCAFTYCAYTHRLCPYYDVLSRSQWINHNMFISSA